MGSCGPCTAVPGFQNITQMHGSVKDARAIVGYDPALNARVVAFMGTNTNLRTWIDDVLLIPQPCYRELGCSGCNCHPGFKHTYDNIADRVYGAVSKLPSGPLIITGHSLGAAQATHCAIDMHSRGITPAHVYTFGQPRVGSDEFANYYDRLGFDHWRVTHRAD